MHLLINLAFKVNICYYNKVKWIILPLSLLLINCSRTPGAQEYCGFERNEYHQRISWKTNLPVKLYINKNVPTSFYPAINTAVGEYNRHGTEFFRIIEYDLDVDSHSDKDGYSVINWTPNWNQNPIDEAVTSLYWSGNEAFEADIMINVYNFNLSITDPINPVELDAISLLIHELGHVLGLNHNLTNGSVMFPVLKQGEIRRELSVVDLNNLKCEY